MLATAASIVTPMPAVPAVAATGRVPAFDHVFIIVMENRAYSDVIGNTAEAPYINQLAAQYGVAANYDAVTHPSLPNYLALSGASTFGITSDCTDCFVAKANVVTDRVQTSGRTWKAYMESMPAPCFVGDSSPYMQKHDPFMYYDDVRKNPTECNQVVPYSQLATDLASTTTTPSYVWITPNMCNDMHDCSTQTGDTWLKNNVPLILRSPAFVTQKSLLLITWDEDDNSQGNQVPTLVIAKGVPPGFQSHVPYNHYSLLKTVEQAWKLAPLTADDGKASPMSDFFPSGTP
jgi:acid phosphatase